MLKCTPRVSSLYNFKYRNTLKRDITGTTNIRTKIDEDRVDGPARSIKLKNV